MPGGEAAQVHRLPQHRIRPIAIGDHTEWSPHEHIYAKYDADPDLQPLYARADGLKHPFGQVDRLKLLSQLIEKGAEVAGCGVDIDKCVEEGDILRYLPLHDPAAAKRLERAYVRAQLPGSQPNDLLKDYFGEKLALFYVFLCHYTSWCGWLALAGLAASVDQFVEGTLATVGAEALPAVVVVWAVMMLEFWKRREATTAMRWGMSDFETREHDRPEYFGELIASPINGQPVTSFPTAKRSARQALAVVVTAGMLALVMGFLGFCFWFKNVQSTAATLINSAGIQLFNLAFGVVAVDLTSLENYRTDTQFEDALITKLFAFQFINSYAPLYYIAFLQEPVFGDACEYGGCLSDLCVTLAITVGGNIAAIFATSYVVPSFKIAYMKWREGGHAAAMSTPELQDLMVHYDAQLDTIAAYMQLARSFGYMILFIVAFPITPLLSYVSNYLQLRVDAWKLVNMYQRVRPGGAQDIGTWQTVFTAIAGAAVITNAALCVFVMSTFDSLAMGNLTYFKAWMFIIFQYFLFGLMVIFSIVVPDVPYDVEIQLQRQTFINEKIIAKVADDDDSVELKDSDVKIEAAEKDEGVYFKTIEELFLISS